MTADKQTVAHSERSERGSFSWFLHHRLSLNDGAVQGKDVSSAYMSVIDADTFFLTPIGCF